MTFEEWYEKRKTSHSLSYHNFRECWQAAQDALRAKGTRAAICDRPDGSITATTHPCSSFNINGWVIKDDEAK